jgi:hypothetical protein
VIRVFWQPRSRFMCSRRPFGNWGIALETSAPLRQSRIRTFVVLEGLLATRQTRRRRWQRMLDKRGDGVRLRCGIGWLRSRIPELEPRRVPVGHAALDRRFLTRSLASISAPTHTNLWRSDVNGRSPKAERSTPVVALLLGHVIETVRRVQHLIA